MYVFEKISEDSNPASYTVEADIGASLSMTVLWFSGRGAGDATVQVSSNAGNGTSPISASIAGLTAGAGDDVVAIHGVSGNAYDGAWSGSPPSGYTERQVRNSGDGAFGQYVSTRDGVSAGSTGPLSAELSNSSWGGDYYGIVVSLPSGGASSATISDATPSGTIGTANTATVGCTTDTEEGTLYAVLSETDNVEEADPEEIEAGENENGDPADFADDVEVTDSSPEVSFTSLTAATTYYYAMVHKTDGGYSNVLSGSFTTAAAAVVATKLLFSAQPGNTVVGQTMSAVQVAAVDDDNELDTSFDGNVTIALQTGDGTQLGTLTKAAVGGLATFDDLSNRTLNEGAVLRATADGLTAADSNEFDITAGGSGGTTGMPSSSRLGGLLQ